MDFLVPPEGGEPRGDWETEEGVTESLLARMEYFLTTLMHNKLPKDMIAELTFRKPHTAVQRGGEGGGCRKWMRKGELEYRQLF